MRTRPGSSIRQLSGLLSLALSAVAWAGSANAQQEVVLSDYSWTDGYRYDHASCLTFDSQPVMADGALAWQHSFPLLLDHHDVEVTQAKLVLTAEYERAGEPVKATICGQAVRWMPKEAGAPVMMTLVLPLPKENPELWQADALTVRLPASASGVRVTDAKLLVQFEERPSPVPDPATTKLRAALPEPAAPRSAR